MHDLPRRQPQGTRAPHARSGHAHTWRCDSFSAIVRIRSAGPSILDAAQAPALIAKLRQGSPRGLLVAVDDGGECRGLLPLWESGPCGHRQGGSPAVPLRRLPLVLGAPEIPAPRGQSAMPPPTPLRESHADRITAQPGRKRWRTIAARGAMAAAHSLPGRFDVNERLKVAWQPG